MALNSQQWARKKIADGLVQQCTFPTIFMQKLEKSTPGLLWVNTTPNQYYSYNISLVSAYCPLKEALWISVHPLHMYSMFPSPLKYQYCLLPAILLIPFLWEDLRSTSGRELRSWDAIGQAVRHGQ